MKKIITESQLKQMIKETVKRLLTEDKVSDYIKKQIVNNSRYSKEMLSTPLAELPKDVRSNMQESAPSIYNACVNHGQNLSAFLRLYFLSYFDINHGKGPVEYVMGLARIAIGELKMFDRNAESDTALLKQVVLFLHNSTDEQLKAQYDGNLNGLDFYTLVRQLNGARREFNAANRTRLKGATDGRVSAYKVVAINSAEEAAKYGRYTSWCVTHSEANYDGYTEGGRRFYFCLRDGFENVPEEVGEGCPLDDYGLSMISVLVDPEGEPNVVTTRWNHENDGENNENLHTAEQVQEVTNIDFYATFKPYSLEQLTAMGITPFYVVQDMLDKGAKPEDIFVKIDEEEYGLRRVYLNNKYNFIDGENKLLFDRWFDYTYDFKEGFAIVELDSEWNFINTEGRILSKQWFDNVWPFFEGFAGVELNDKRNFINTKGQLLSKQWFDAALDFSEGFVGVELNGKYNFINTEGQLLSQQWFDWVGNFMNGFAMVQLNVKWNFLNTEGQLLSQQWFDWVGNFMNGFAIVQLNGKYNFINTEGRILSNQWFDGVGPFIEGFAQVYLNGKCNFISTEGRILSNQWFDNMRIFIEGFAGVRLNGKWNFINTEGQLLSKQWFDDAGNFSEGFVVVRLNGKRYNLDKEGNLTLAESRRSLYPIITESIIEKIKSECIRRILSEKEL